MKIAQLGTFDVENYGDLLFPLLAKKRLGIHFADLRLDPVSPIGGPPVWEDSPTSVGYDDFARQGQGYEGFLVGGGNIVRVTPSDLDAYNNGDASLLGYANLWAGVAAENCHNQLPICWNAPGVPEPLPMSLRPLLRACLERVDYLSVRDNTSRELLKDIAPEIEVSVVPDPAWEIDMLWTAEALDLAYQRAFTLRSSSVPDRSVAIHLNSRYLGASTIQSIAGHLDGVCRHLEAKGILVAIGPCHGDHKLARTIGAYMESDPLIVDRPASLIEVAACIARSAAYVGSSMHGFITASSFCLPAIVLSSPRVVKFPGLLAQIGLPELLQQSWPDACERVRTLFSQEHVSALHKARKDQQTLLNSHWSKIISILQKSQGWSSRLSNPATQEVARAGMIELRYRETLLGGLAMQMKADNKALKSRAEAEIRVLKTRADELAILVNELRSSPSWRITAPLRATSRGISWFRQNARRALVLTWWLVTGQFNRSVRALLPYLQRYAPRWIKAMLPKKAHDLVREWLTVKRVSSLAASDPAMKDAIGKAEAAMRSENWHKALTRWQTVLDGSDGKHVVGHAKLNISVARRLSRIDACKEQIDEYAKARASRNSQSNNGERKIAIYTSISGGYDSIKLPEWLDPRFDYVLFTDAPAPDTGVWQVRPITYFHKDQTRTARFVKTHPHMLLADYEIAVWVDSNIMVLGDIYPLVEGFLASGKAVAAIPHPLRRSVYEEVDTCIQLNKDESTIMREQVDRYQQAGFNGSDLIESNLMMFDLGKERVRLFLDFWWSEIERYSKREQLSLNYALKQFGIEWHRLTDYPNSTRDHPMFAFVPHDGGDGPVNQLINKLQVPVVDPYAGPSYADIREERLTARGHHRIDIVACVHDALDDVRSCLESVRRTRGSEHQRLIIIDDGSDEPTARYLQEFTSRASWAELYRNEQARGYTRAANQGLAASTGELVILLNSDTVVTDGWAEKLADAVFSTPGAGIVGPMSNAASHQSIPDHLSTKDQTAINNLPPGLAAEDMNRFCEEWTVAGVLPRVPLVHGFCFGVTRNAIDRIGRFDEDSFPKGYGEENDYCFRATDAGFSLVIATHTFVFHAKSKSYVGPERVVLMKAGSEALARLHGRTRIQRAVRSMQENPIFMDLRQRTRRLCADLPLLPDSDGRMHGVRRPIDRGKRQRSVVALLPARVDGHPDGTAYIRVLRPLRHRSLTRVLKLSLEDNDRGMIGLDHDALLIQRDAVTSPKCAHRLVERCRERQIRLIYEIDDDLLHLPETHPAAERYSSPAVREAMLTIMQQSDAVIVSTTPLKKQMTAFNKNVFVLPNALDEGLWLPDGGPRWGNRQRDETKILYMGTRTHDGDLALVIDAIRALKEKYGDRVTFTCIGVFDKNPAEMATVENPPEWASAYPEFAQWMARSCEYDIAIAPLVDNDFNRHKSFIKYLDYGVCGFAPVLSNITPYRDVVRHGENGMLLENDAASWYETLCTLIENPAMRDELGRNAHEDVLAHHTLAAQAEQRQWIWAEILS